MLFIVGDRLVFQANVTNSISLKMSQKIVINRLNDQHYYKI